MRGYASVIPVMTFRSKIFVYSWPVALSTTVTTYSPDAKSDTILSGSGSGGLFGSGWAWKSISAHGSSRKHWPHGSPQGSGSSSIWPVVPSLLG